MSLFLCHREGGGVLHGGLSIAPFLPHGTGVDHEGRIVQPEAANLIKQLE